MKLASVPEHLLELVLEQIKAEGVELVEKPPETLRTEFGLGRANGILITIKRFRELLNFEIAKYLAEKGVEGDDF